MAREIVFYCRFGGKLGWGHVVRCSALAEAAQDSGWNTKLYTRSDLSVLGEETRAAFNEVVDEGSVALEEVVESADVLFVDEMYWKDSDFERVAKVTRSRGCCLAATDDMQQRVLECVDLILNPEPGLRGRPYKSNGRQLVGEDYCLLRRGFREVDEDFRSGLAEGLMPVLVMLGGNDAFGLSGMVLKCLREMGDERLAPVLISGELGTNEAGIQRVLSGFDEYKWLIRLDSESLARWMKTCHLAIVGCGSSMYELAAMRTSFIGLSLVDNQERSAEAAARNWGARIVDNPDSIGFESELMNAVREMLDRESGYRFENVDAVGALRVIKELEAICEANRIST